MTDANQDAAAAPAAPKRRFRPLRWLGLIVLVLLVLGGGAVGGAWWWLGHGDVAGFAAARLGGALGRAVTIGRIQVTPGRWARLEVADLVIPGLTPEGPAFLSLHHATAEVDVTTVLHGHPVVRVATVEGLHMFLERGPDRTPNWHFGPKRPKADPAVEAAKSRAGIPALRLVTATDIDITYRTTGGKDLVTHLDTARIETANNDSRVALTAAGTYQKVPAALDADLAPLTALWDTATPYPTTLHLRSNDDVQVGFEGTMTDPINVDGAKGTLTLDTENPTPILAMAGSSSTLDTAVHISGDFTRNGDHWKLADAFGAVNDDSLVEATLSLVEGTAKEPDTIGVAMEFDRLNLDAILGSGPKDKRGGADVPLTIDPDSGVQGEATLKAREVHYGEFDAGDVTFTAKFAGDRLTVDTLALTLLGAKVKAEGKVEADSNGGRIDADIDVSGADVQVMRRRLGFGNVPVAGRLEGRFRAQGSGRTVNEATRGARISAVVAMRGGSIARDVIEMASTDVRALFRTAKGMTAISCLLAGVDIRAGVGTVAPLRIRAAEGTVAGSARFDLNRRTMDLTIGSESRSTGFFALDIPVRVYGSFASPDIRPAQWSAQGRAALAAADDLGQLPPGLQAMARQYPCPPSQRR